jgi:peptide/nickel transport system permease protein
VIAIAMREYLIRRLVLIPFLLLAITVIDFAFINLAPGDPVTAMLDPQDMRKMSKADIEARREALGLNKPIYVRYLLWLKEVFRGNLGHSMIQSRPVADLMLVGIRNTFTLMLLSLVISTLVGIVLGIVSALRPYSFVDYILTGVAFTGVAMPSFFLALILILIGAVELGWFPTSGIVTPGAPPSLWDRLNHMVLPLIALSYNGMASILRYTRSSMLEVLNQDYILAARAKGLPERLILGRHAFKNALLPIITIMGLNLPELFGGSVIVETLFNIPGIGSLMVSALNARDYPVIMGGILLSGLLVLFSNLLADISYALADPRVRY